MSTINFLDLTIYKDHVWVHHYTRHNCYTNTHHTLKSNHPLSVYKGTYYLSRENACIRYARTNNYTTPWPNAFVKDLLQKNL